MHVEWQLAKRVRMRVRAKTPRSIRTVRYRRSWPASWRSTSPPTHRAKTPASCSDVDLRPALARARRPRAFQRAVQAAGLPPGRSIHDLRHHYASVLLAAGESVVAVAERLGREDALLVLSTYGHLMPDSEDRTRRAIDDAWSSSEDLVNPIARVSP